MSNQDLDDTKSWRLVITWALPKLAATFAQDSVAKFNRKRQTPSLNLESGFSLLEALVAVAVVSILIVAIAPMVALSTSARVNARRIDQATQAGRSYIDAVRGGVINTSTFPNSLVKSIANAQGQYVFEDPVTSSNSVAPPTAALLALDSSSASTPVRGIRVDADGNGFSVNDPQDLVIQPMRSGPLSSDAEVQSILGRRGFWLAVRVYRADALAGGTTLKTGNEPECARSKLAFANTASIACPLVTMRSQIPATDSQTDIGEIGIGIGSSK